jgi:hypothetical protein
MAKGHFKCLANNLALVRRWNLHSYCNCFCNQGLDVCLIVVFFFPGVAVLLLLAGVKRNSFPCCNGVPVFTGGLY